MMILVPSICPACQEQKGALDFWKKVDNKYFHLCDKCCQRELSQDELLRVGFHYGYVKAKEEMKDFLN